MLEYVLLFVGMLVLGLIIGFFGGKGILRKYLKENSAITEEMVKMMFVQMGVKPNQKKINKVMQAIEKNKSKK